MKFSVGDLQKIWEALDIAYRLNAEAGPQMLTALCVAAEDWEIDRDTPVDVLEELQEVVRDVPDIAQAMREKILRRVNEALSPPLPTYH